MKNYYCLVNFELKKYSKASIHISDVALHRGYGIFDFFRSRNGKLLWIDDYIKRIFASAKKARIELDFTKKEFKNVIKALHKKNKIENGYFKIIITGGYSDNYYKIENPPNVVIINRPFNGLPEAHYKKGASLITKKFVRDNALIKSLNYFGSVYLQQERESADAVDVLYYDQHIYEASRSNIFLVKGKKIYTPKSDILMGVTRKNVIKLIKNEYEIKITDIPFEKLFSFDEIFLTGTGKDILPIVKIDNKKIGKAKPGSVTVKCMDLFRQKFLN